jgi:hypothetical protein
VALSTSWRSDRFLAHCTSYQKQAQSTTYFRKLPASNRLTRLTHPLADISHQFSQTNPATNKSRITHAKPIAPRVRRASGFVQIFLSQVPRRETLGSPPKLTAGALVDRKLRFYANNEVLRVSVQYSVARADRYELAVCNCCWFCFGAQTL